MKRRALLFSLRTVLLTFYLTFFEAARFFDTIQKQQLFHTV